MAFEIVFTATSTRHYKGLDARWRAAIKSGIETHLRHEPTKTSKSRIKRLREMEQPQYRLRVTEYRVFFDVEQNDVVILAIVPKAQAEDWLNQFGKRST